MISGEIAWYETRAGTYQVTLTASDGVEEVEHTFTLTVEKASQTDEGMGNAAFYIVIVLLLALVVFLVLKMMAGGGGEPAPVSGTEDGLVEDEPVVEDEAGEGSTDGPEDGPKDE